MFPRIVFSLFVICGIISSLHASARFLKEHIPPSNVRYRTFQSALELMKQRGVKLLVETGTARGGKHNSIGDGASTLIFAEWAYHNEAILYTVDIDPLALKAAKKDLHRRYHPAVHFIEGDSVQFLREFSQPIEFLYLDSFDFELNNPGPSQQHHLKEIQAAYPHLTPLCIVMIDDCDLPHGGKGKLVIDYLLKKGWMIYEKGYQVILVRQK